MTAPGGRITRQRFPLQKTCLMTIRLSPTTIVKTALLTVRAIMFLTFEGVLKNGDRHQEDLEPVPVFQQIFTFDQSDLFHVIER